MLQGSFRAPSSPGCNSQAATAMAASSSDWGVTSNEEPWWAEQCFSSMAPGGGSTCGEGKGGEESSGEGKGGEESRGGKRGKRSRPPSPLPAPVPSPAAEANAVHPPELCFRSCRGCLACGCGRCIADSRGRKAATCWTASGAADGRAASTPITVASLPDSTHCEGIGGARWPGGALQRCEACNGGWIRIHYFTEPRRPAPPEATPLPTSLPGPPAWPCGPPTGPPPTVSRPAPPDARRRTAQRMQGGHAAAPSVCSHLATSGRDDPHFEHAARHLSYHPARSLLQAVRRTSAATAVRAAAAAVPRAILDR